jgi:hypothetical protein
LKNSVYRCCKFSFFLQHGPAGMRRGLKRIVMENNFKRNYDNKIVSVNHNYKKWNSSSFVLTTCPPNDNINWVGKVQEFIVSQHLFKYEIGYVGSKKSGLDHQPMFEETYVTRCEVLTGYGPNKQKAKNDCYRKIYISLLINIAELQEEYNSITKEVSKPQNDLQVFKPQDKKHEPIGVALYPYKTKIDDKSVWEFVRKEYFNETQELLHYSKNADCYRNYQLGDEFSRVPDLSGFENSEYTNFRLNRTRKLQKRKTREEESNLPPVKIIPVETTTVVDERLLRFLTRLSTEVSSMIEGDDCDMDFLKKFLLGVDAPQKSLEAIKLMSVQNTGDRHLNQKDLEGGFNPYGNGQYSLEQYTMTKPGYNLSDQTWSCFSTCLMPDPVHIIGTGATQTDAFTAWMAQCSDHMMNWAPVESVTILTELRKLPKPPSDSFLLPLWESHEPIRYFKDLVIQQLKYTDKRHKNQKDSEGTHNPYGNAQPSWVDTSRDHGSDFIPGTYNPYGNGQPPLLNKGQYLSQNKQSFSKLSQAQKEEKWKKYRDRHSIDKNARPKVRLQKTTNQKVVGNIPSTTRITPRQAKRYVQQISPCAKGYLVALKCPFFWLDQEIPKCVDINFPKDLPCIPGPDQYNTRKWSAFARGTLTINSNGHGWILIAPDRVANNNSTADNRSCPILTSTTATLVTAGQFPTVDDGAGGFGTAGAATNHNGDYVLAQLITNARGQGVKSRLVGCAVRVQYTGPKLTEAGLAHFIVEPDHASLSAYSTTDIGKFEGYFSRNIHRTDTSWNELTYSPVQPEDLQFHPDGNANATFGPTTDHFMGIMFTGLPTGDYIRYEVIFLFESIGNLIRGKTLNPVDPVGVAVALNGISSDTQAQNDKGGTPLSTTINQGKDMMSGLKDIVEAPMKIVENLLPLGKMFL